MTRQEILVAITEVFGKVFGNKDLELKEFHSAVDFENWDSINNMIIIARIEKIFAIRIPTIELIKIKNVGDLITSIQNKLENGTSGN